MDEREVRLSSCYTMEAIKAILLNHLRGSITASEQRDLDAWLAASAANRELFAELNDPDRVALSLEKLGLLHEERVWQRLQAYAGESVPMEETGMRERRWWPAAAVIIALLGIGSYWVFHNGAQKQIALTQEQRFKNDVAPGKNAAVLTLAGGRQIVLDSTARGTIGQQGNSTIVNTTGQLVYNELQEKPAEILYNTLTTGSGNQYQLVLPDGSRVWLNAASSITYPSAFTGEERKVAITGEAYFEVASQTPEGRHEKTPFIVHASGMEVKVLGTHFNINTYDDEEAMKTTLLEGRVKVTKGDNISLLRPGQQAVVPGDKGAIKVINDPHIDEVMAWKNGAFIFNDATIESIMRQLARWYDVSVIYDTKITQHFNADVPRDVPVSELLKLLELTDQVHFKIEGKKITVIR